MGFAVAIAWSMVMPIETMRAPDTNPMDEAVEQERLGP